MERGVQWPQNIEDALRRSKILIAIDTPPSFRSRWYMAEWRSTQKREELLRRIAPDKSQGLIHPILNSDSDNFPAFARKRSWWDVVFQKTKEWPGFHMQVEQVAIDLARHLPQVSEWQAGWPVDRPKPAMPRPVPLSRV